jgi:hypothetical protein
MMTVTRFARAALVALIMIACCSLLPVPRAAAQLEDSVPTAELDPAFAVAWMELLYQRIMAEGYNPPSAARLYGYAGVTLYESVVWGIPTNRSLIGQVNGLTDLPFPDDAAYDWAAVANAALSTALHGLMYESGSDTHAAISALRADQLEERAAQIDADTLNRSIQFGDDLAKALLEWADADNYRETRGLEYEFQTGYPFLWQATNPDLLPVEPFWGEVRPFALDYTEQCDVPLDMEFSAEADSTFYQQALEVMNTGDRLDRDQRATAAYWLDNLSETGTPAGHWVLIENQLVEQLDLTLDAAAQMYGMTNMALADAFTGCWALKYRVLLLRPETYIQEYISPRWRPYITTPMFPEYPSGHSVVSAAAAQMLTALFGQVAFTDTAKVQFGMPPRSYTSFDAAAQEAATSRLYGGIHFRAAIENGMDMGRCIADQLLNRIVMNQLLQGE